MPPLFAGSHVSRVLLTENPFSAVDDREIWGGRGRWPASWIAVETKEVAFVAGYRLRLNLVKPLFARVHVSGDERYELYVDGVRVGGGPERGDIQSWAAETFEISLEPGEHILAARAFTLKDGAAFAQMSLRHGFLFCADDEGDRDQLSTGHAPWEAAILPGYGFVPAEECWGTGVFTELDGAKYPWGWESGTDSLSWAPAMVVQPATGQYGTNETPPTRLLRRATLPAQYEGMHSGVTVEAVLDHPSLETAGMPVHLKDSIKAEAAAWQAMLDGAELTIPPNTTRRVLIDLNNYVCGMPILNASGGAGSTIKAQFIEALFTGPRTVEKRNRDEIDGKYFHQMWSFRESVGDVYHLDGGPQRHFAPLWWNAGRYVQVLVRTDKEPLKIHSFGIREHRYPLENEAEFWFSDARLEGIVPIMHRTLQMCSHETYMDCPFYEQLQYVGDTRLQALITYVTSSDDRLPRQALTAFDLSRQITGLTQSRYPNRVMQLIPPFSLWYVAMVYDFALWRGDFDFIKPLMVGVRGVLDHYRNLLNRDDLLTAADGWNFLDWVPSWKAGVPADGQVGISGPLNLQFALVLRLAAKLESWVGEEELSRRNAATADRLIAATFKHFYSETRGMVADNLDKTIFSEHAQCLALLEGTGPHLDRIEKGLLEAGDLARTTIYFSHYLFETFAKLGRGEEILKRMDLWFWHLTSGLKTTIEHPEPSRSDCHAWAAHPLYHYVASFGGYRPLTPGGATFEIRPDFAGMSHFATKFQTKLGEFRLDFSREVADITVPNGATGTLHLDGKAYTLIPGTNKVHRGNA